MPVTNVSELVSLGTAYWDSAAFLAANRLGVFGALGEQTLTAQEVAEACETPAPSMELLLRAVASLGLIERNEAGYRNTELAQQFLVPGKPTYLGQAMRYADDMFPVWAKLAEALRTGQPAMKPETILGDDPEQTRSFVLGMHNRAVAVASEVVRHLDLSGRSRLLDVGGGPGTYSMLLCKQTPGLTADVLELSGVADVAEELIAEWGMTDRLTMRRGDYHETDFGDGYDAVLMSGMFHRETAESCRDLLRRAARSLNPGGLCVVVDVCLNENKDGPTFATLFALNMFLTSDAGSAHSWTEIGQWMQAAGFAALETVHLRPPSPHTMVKGRLPNG